MASEFNLYKFNKIYEETHLNTLRYVIIKCNNFNSIDDIMQETYLELWNILNNKDLSNINIQSYIIGIANNKLKKHYSLIQKIKTISLFETNDKDIELIDTIKDNIDIDDLVIKEDNWKSVWKFIKSKKNQDIPKVFYLYYELELSIKDIAEYLNKGESYIKNLIYRTLQELKVNFGEGEYSDE